MKETHKWIYLAEGKDLLLNFPLLKFLFLKKWISTIPEINPPICAA